MPILKTIQTPNFSLSEYHYVRRYEMSFTDNKSLATILSYANEQAFLSGAGPLWTHPVAVPCEVCGQPGEVINNIESWLISGAVSFPFIGGNIISDASQTFDNLKERTWDKVKSLRSFYEYNGFYTDKGRFDSDEESVRRIAAATTTAILSKSSGSPYSIEWTLSDNSNVILNSDDMIAVGVAAVEHVTETHDFARQLRIKIDLAMTKEELDVILLEIWPAVLVS